MRSLNYSSYPMTLVRPRDEERGSKRRFENIEEIQSKMALNGEDSNGGGRRMRWKVMGMSLDS